MLRLVKLWKSSEQQILITEVIAKLSTLSDRRRQFAISDDGTVTIQRELDRESVPTHQIKILAIDDGDPPKTATATLTVIVEDINDNVNNANDIMDPKKDLNDRENNTGGNKKILESNTSN